MKTTFSLIELMIKKNSILGIRARFSFDSNQQRDFILNWAKGKNSRFVCCCNTHMLVIAKQSLKFREEVFTCADLITLDGKPIEWLVKIKSIIYWIIGYSRKINIKKIQQVCGRDLMHKVLLATSEESISVGFYGSSFEILNNLLTNIKTMYPNLNISFVYSPPYRTLTSEETSRIITSIHDAGTRILFVSLGCPKQEYWMAENRDTIQAVMIGVGGAFEVLAQMKPTPPLLVQNLGFEWLFRLILDPKRLFFRNLYYNPKFLYILISRFCLKSFRHLISKFKLILVYLGNKLFK